MDRSTKTIAAEVEKLPAEQQAELVDDILARLLAPVVPSIEAAWRSEIGHRLDAYESGDMAAYPAEDVFARLREKFRPAD
jgi:putative addiction module component (TIGR02574 family)